MWVLYRWVWQIGQWGMVCADWHVYNREEPKHVETCSQNPKRKRGKGKSEEATASHKKQ